MLQAAGDAGGEQFPARRRVQRGQLPPHRQGLAGGDSGAAERAIGLPAAVLVTSPDETVQQGAKARCVRLAAADPGAHLSSVPLRGRLHRPLSVTARVPAPGGEGGGVVDGQQRRGLDGLADVRPRVPLADKGRVEAGELVTDPPLGAAPQHDTGAIRRLRSIEVGAAIDAAVVAGRQAWPADSVATGDAPAGSARIAAASSAPARNTDSARSGGEELAEQVRRGQLPGPARPRTWNLCRDFATSPRPRLGLPRPARNPRG